MLLARAAPVIEDDNTLGRSRQIGDDETDMRVQFARTPFDLGHNMARLVPALRLIAEAGVVTSYLVWGSSDWALQQMSDLILQNLIGRQPDRVACTLGFKKLIDLGIGEGCIASEIQIFYNAPVRSNHRLQPCAPAIGAMDVARPQRTPFNIAKLVEHEQWVIAGTSEMTVIGAAFLFAVGGAFARIHVEYDGLRPSPPAHFVNPLTGQIGERGKIGGPAQPFCLKAAHLARRSGRPANCPTADHPAHRRITAQPPGIVHVLIAGQPPEYRLAQKARQPIPTVLPSARIGQLVSSGIG